MFLHFFPFQKICCRDSRNKQLWYLSLCILFTLLNGKAYTLNSLNICKSLFNRSSSGKYILPWIYSILVNHAHNVIAEESDTLKLDSLDKVWYIEFCFLIYLLLLYAIWTLNSSCSILNTKFQICFSKFNRVASSVIPSCITNASLRSMTCSTYLMLFYSRKTWNIMKWSKDKLLCIEIRFYKKNKATLIFFFWSVWFSGDFWLFEQYSFTLINVWEFELFSAPFQITNFRGAALQPLLQLSGRLQLVTSQV